MFGNLVSLWSKQCISKHDNRSPQTDAEGRFWDPKPVRRVRGHLDRDPVASTTRRAAALRDAAAEFRAGHRARDRQNPLYPGVPWQKAPGLPYLRPGTLKKGGKVRRPLLLLRPKTRRFRMKSRSALPTNGPLR